MERSAYKRRQAAKSRSLSDAVQRARVRLAEDIDNVAERRISDLTRLEMLKGELDGIFSQIPKTDQRFELILVPSAPVRLWLDMFTYVAREPENGNYCLIRNGPDGPEVLAESSVATEIIGRVIDYVADELVRRERQLHGYAQLERRMQTPARHIRRPAMRLSVAFFIIGLVTGILALLSFFYLAPI